MRKATLAAALVTMFIGRAIAQDAPAAPAAEPPPVVTPALPAPSPWAAQIEAARARHDDWLACVRAKRFKCDDKAQPDPMEALFNDDTLVEGDIVATPHGLKVFHGQPETPHRWEDFR
jgi:hypothetical protein